MDRNFFKCHFQKIKYFTQYLLYTLFMFTTPLIESSTQFSFYLFPGEDRLTAKNQTPNQYLIRQVMLWFAPPTVINHHGIPKHCRGHVLIELKGKNRNSISTFP
jgi:hypothetical protein